MKYIIGVFLLSVACASHSIEITTENSEKSELATVDMLQALLQDHDTSKWEFTHKVHIKNKTIPHSHPILTLHTRHTSKEQQDVLLSTYLHEQIHWHLHNHQQKTAAAISDLKTIFNPVPVGFPQGGRNEYSTYLHLLVCYLELEAISELLGKQREFVVSRFLQQDHYTWIYAQVQNKKIEIANVIENHGLEIL